MQVFLCCQILSPFKHMHKKRKTSILLLWIWIQLFCVLIPSSTNSLNVSPSACSSICKWHYYSLYFSAVYQFPWFCNHSVEEVCGKAVQSLSLPFPCVPSHKWFSLCRWQAFLDHFSPFCLALITQNGDSSTEGKFLKCESSQSAWCILPPSCGDASFEFLDLIRDMYTCWISSFLCLGESWCGGSYLLCWMLVLLISRAGMCYKETGNGAPEVFSIKCGFGLLPTVFIISPSVHALYQSI